jgi:hypothetical protein
MTIPQTLPTYVDRGGEQVWRPPGRARDVELYGFVLPARRSAIDVLLQRDLVAPSGGEVDYRCAHDNVIITFGAIGREASGDPIDSQRGYICEREVSVWCLVADVRARGRLLWYLPYIFTDTGQTVATGREIFGYPKQLGLFRGAYTEVLERPAGGRATVRAYAVDPYDPESQVVERDMISVRRKRAPASRTSSAGSIAEELSLFFDGGLEIDATLPSGPGSSPRVTITAAGAPAPRRPPAVHPKVRGILSALSGAVLGGGDDVMIADLVADPTLVFLKQFRDVACPTKACYQAVIEAPLSVELTGASYRALDPSLFSVTVQSWAGDPIAADLGIDAATPLPPARAFYAAFGFDIELGVEVWRAPT